LIALPVLVYDLERVPRAGARAGVTGMVVTSNDLRARDQGSAAVIGAPLVVGSSWDASLGTLCHAARRGVLAAHTDAA